ncbi:hypothetical protein BKA66DRAFT_575631 [Pyrenochaeta sp. MPI-SDFR-AT-0127]|nr:hypothetical protein BKA66DRAFT_575631 [Pyrenochaeta sp. MPI-SDFR-AT-0127]
MVVPLRPTARAAWSRLSVASAGGPGRFAVDSWRCRWTGPGEGCFTDSMVTVKDTPTPADAGSSQALPPAMLQTKHGVHGGGGGDDEDKGQDEDDPKVQQQPQPARCSSGPGIVVFTVFNLAVCLDRLCPACPRLWWVCPVVLVAGEPWDSRAGGGMRLRTMTTASLLALAWWACLPACPK